MPQGNGNSARIRKRCNRLRRQWAVHRRHSGTAATPPPFAAQSIRPYKPLGEGVPDIYAPHLPTRLPIVRTRPYSYRNGKRAIGRRREKAFDRPASICFAHMPWGEASIGWFGGIAASALELLRSADPFLATLPEPELRPVHAAAAAALGIIDTATARKAPPDLVEHHLERR